MGIIVGVGGGRTDDNEILPIFEHTVSLSKKKKPTVLFVPTSGFDDINGDGHSSGRATIGEIVLEQ